MQHRKLIVRDDYYAMTDAELGEAVDSVRLAIATSQPLHGRHVRVLEEAARRLHAIQRVALNDNEQRKGT